MCLAERKSSRPTTIGIMPSLPHRLFTPRNGSRCVRMMLELTANSLSLLAVRELSSRHASSVPRPQLTVDYQTLADSGRVRSMTCDLLIRANNLCLLETIRTALSSFVLFLVHNDMGQTTFYRTRAHRPHGCDLLTTYVASECFICLTRNAEHFYIQKKCKYLGLFGTNRRQLRKKEQQWMIRASRFWK